jgi:hypothetical protein
VLRDLVEHRIDGLVNVFGLSAAPARHFALDDVEFPLRSQARFEITPPFQLRSGPAEANKSHRGDHRCPQNDQVRPVMVRQGGQSYDRDKNERDPFHLDAQQHFHVWIEGGERDENAEMERGGAGNSDARPQADNREEQRRHPEEKQIEKDESAPAEIAFHFAPEGEKHVHLDRKPKKRAGRIRQMDKRIGRNLPDPA